MDSPFQPVVQNWISVIRLGCDAKDRRFGADAREGKKFFSGTYEFLWNQLKTDRHMRAGDDSAVAAAPASIQVQVNKASELVQLFGPALYARNPVRTVTPRTMPELPAELYAMMAGPTAQPAFEQALAQDHMQRTIDKYRAAVLETYLNYTPNALGLREQARLAVDEALIKGAGVMWHEPYTPPGGAFKMVGSFQGSIDDLVIDPDATSLRDAKWVARRCVHPVWQVERDRGLPPGSLRGTYESTSASAAENAQAEHTFTNRQDGKSNDLLVYWKVWSKMGVGGRLRLTQPEVGLALEAYGDMCYVEVAANTPHPLNVPPDVQADPQEVLRRLQWPTPFWADGGWPMTMVYFHDVPDEPWPLSHLAPAMGELKFLNWAMGHIAAKVATTSRDFIAVLKSAGEDIKTKILRGGDLELLEISEVQGRTISEIVQFLQHPTFNGDIWKVIEAVMDQFDRRTGLVDLLYGVGAGPAIRSGSEAQTRAQGANVRPDDMAEMVEAAMGLCGRREALAARWHLTPQDVGPVLGPIGASWWEQLVYAASIDEIVFNLEYRVEAGSARKPNKARDQDQANGLMNNLFQPFFQYAGSTGNVKPANALIEFWCKANDIANVEDFQLTPMPPPGPGGPAQPGGTSPPPGPPSQGPPTNVGG